MFHVKHMEMEGGGGHGEEGGSQVFVPLFHVKHEADSDGGADPVLSTSATGRNGPASARYLAAAEG